MTDLDAQKATIAEGASYLKQAVERMEGDALDKVATLRLLAPKYDWIGEQSECIRYYDQAYALLPGPECTDLSVAKREEVETTRLDILTFKAGVFSGMNQPENALQCFEEARRYSGEQPLPGWKLDDLTIIFNEEYDADGTKLMKMLKSWTRKERETWFAYCFEDWVDANAVNRMQRAARLSKETDLLLEWLTSLANTLPAQSYYLFNLKGAIARLYYPVLGDIEKGKILRQEILAMKPKPEAYYEETMNETKSQHRMQLADILFHEFQASSDPAKKEELIESLRHLPSAHANDDNIQESHIGMLRANMVRIMGPAREYHKYMSELFTTCINGLEDGVSWNDSSSLRLLSKVLASLDGLERDARIALSAHFSILDRDIHDKDNASESSENSDKDGNGSDAERERAEDKDVVAQNRDIAEVPTTNGVHETPENKAPTETVGEMAATAEIQEAKNVTVSEATATDPDATKSTPVQLPALDEDLSNFGIYCDGGCGTNAVSWTQPFYYCLVCPNCDLCEICYAKRLAQTRGEIEEPWLSYCGKDHRYIKCPMKDWKGIKNGVIRIGEEEIAVKDWLTGLKEERWPKAWETFWTRQSGLKNIGTDD